MHRPISKFEVSKQPTRVMPERCLTPASSVAPAKQQAWLAWLSAVRSRVATSTERRSALTYARSRTQRTRGLARRLVHAGRHPDHPRRPEDGKDRVRVWAIMEPFV
jgi:hypothetical protein